MRIVIFGLSVSSAWGNGHATLWRGLIAALDAAGNEVVFFERGRPVLPPRTAISEQSRAGTLRLYPAWNDVAPRRPSREPTRATPRSSRRTAPTRARAAELVLGRLAACACSTISTRRSR